MLCLSGFELYSRCVPLAKMRVIFKTSGFNHALESKVSNAMQLQREISTMFIT